MIFSADIKNDLWIFCIIKLFIDSISLLESLLITVIEMVKLLLEMVNITKSLWQTKRKTNRKRSKQQHAIE